jgi:hypothetical protein
MQELENFKDASRSITLTGDVVGTVSYTGTGSVSIGTTIASTKFAPVVSPALIGTPTAPTAPAGTNTTQLANTAFVVGEKGGRRNYLINGNFDKWDYATSQTATGYGSDNRWQNSNSSSYSTRTYSQQVCGDTERALFNAMYFSRTVVSSPSSSPWSGDYVVKQQRIENINLLAGKTVTLSFWAKADADKSIAIELYQNFGTGGSPSADVSGVGVQLVALTTTWQKKTITVNIPSIAGKTLGTDGVQTTFTGLNFWFDAGSDYETRTANLGQQFGTFDIAQVKLEDGSIATNGWHPYDGEFGGEEQACGRYYEKVEISCLGYYLDGQSMGNTAQYRTTKRVTPTATLLSDGYPRDNINVDILDQIATLVSISVFRIVSNGGVAQFGETYGISAEL